MATKIAHQVMTGHGHATVAVKTQEADLGLVKAEGADVDLPVEIISDGVPMITVGGGALIPTQQYANQRIEVSLTWPVGVPPDEAALSATYAWMKGWVDDRLQALANEVLAG